MFPFLVGMDVDGIEFYLLILLINDMV